MQIKSVLRGKEYVFETKPGLFSKNEIDEGTRLLIETMEIQPNDSVLDIGCGYGPIGIVAASLASKGKVYMVDTDFRAVNYTKKNIQLNKVPNAEVRISDGLQEMKGKTLDVILSNPPTHLPKETFIEFVESSKKQLRAGGKIYFVTEKRLKPLLKREFERVFGNYTQLTSGPKHIVGMAYKQIVSIEPKKPKW